MNYIKIEDLIKIISKNTGINESLINENSQATDFSKWDSIAHVKIMVELENKIKKKISTSKMSELNSIPKILKFIEM
tara:strand:- start:207 stop:437 length:231 start_codon:yes stop_codon:yes gene_type:complete